MAHKVTFTIPERELGTADIEFSVDKDGDKLGTLKISKGSIVWFPKHARRGADNNGFKLSWSKFDQLMQENAK